MLFRSKNPQPKINSSINGEGTSKIVEEVPNLSKTKSDHLINKGIILDSHGVLNKLVSESPPKRTSCTIEEIFDDLDDGFVDNT